MKKRYIVNKSELNIYVFLIVISIQYAFVNTDLEFTGILSTVFFLIEGIIFGIYLINRKYQLKTFVAICILLLIGVLTYYTTGSTAFVIMLMAAVMFERINYTKAFRLIFVIRLLLLITVIILALAGIIDIYKREIIKSGESSIGYGLGFTHPNRLAFVIQFLILIYLCYKNKHLKKSNLAILLFFTLIGYFITKSRTLLINTTGVLVLIFLLKTSLLHKVTQMIVDIFSPLITPICAAISIIVPLLMLKATGQLQTVLFYINGLLSSRFTHIYRAFLNYPVTLFGGTSDFSKLQDIYSYSTIDNGYIRLLYSFGIIGFCLFILFTVISVKKLIAKKEYIYIIVCMGIAFWGINENILENFAFNFTIIFWSEILKSYHEKKKCTTFWRKIRYASKKNRFSDFIPK